MKVTKEKVIYVIFLILCSSFIVVKNDLALYLELIKKLKTLDTSISKAKAGDWLSANPEPGQSFENFVHTTKKPISSLKRKIYIRPIGKFDNDEYLLIQKVAKDITTFYQYDVVIHPNLPMKYISKKARRKKFGYLQLNTEYINYNILYKLKPKDAIAYIGVTKDDLYNSFGGAFVFGQADQLGGVAIVSIARLGTEKTQAFDRLLKTSNNEIGHLLGIEHCVSAHCLMNGNNSLEETDSHPHFFCAECLAKTGWKTKKRLDHRGSHLLNNSTFYSIDSSFLKQRHQLLQEVYLKYKKP